MRTILNILVKDVIVVDRNGNYSYLDAPPADRTAAHNAAEHSGGPTMTLQDLARSRLFAACLMVALLAACGQEGPPKPPEGAPSTAAPTDEGEPEKVPEVAIPETGIAPV